MEEPPAPERPLLTRGGHSCRDQDVRLQILCIGAARGPVARPSPCVIPAQIDAIKPPGSASTGAHSAQVLQQNKRTRRMVAIDLDHARM